MFVVLVEYFIFEVSDMKRHFPRVLRAPSSSQVIVKLCEQQSTVVLVSLLKEAGID